MFGPSSSYNIGYVSIQRQLIEADGHEVISWHKLTRAMDPETDRMRLYVIQRVPFDQYVSPLSQVLPLATELGLTVDTSCDRDDSDCVATAVEAFAATSSANVLVCWEHKELTSVAESLGVSDAPGMAITVFQIASVKLMLCA